MPTQHDFHISAWYAAQHSTHVRDWRFVEIDADLVFIADF